MRIMKITVFAITIILLSLMAAGCISGSSPSSTATPTPTPTQEPTSALVTATPTPVPSPTAINYAVPSVDLLFTPPPESGYNQNTPIETITGTMSKNGNPAVGYGVQVETISTCLYGNATQNDGSFVVRFRQDNSSTFLIKITDPSGNLIYQDKVPRPMNETSDPFNISMAIPSTNIITWSISPSD
jgi:hypothetical protein